MLSANLTAYVCYLCTVYVRTCLATGGISCGPRRSVLGYLEAVANLLPWYVTSKFVYLFIHACAYYLYLNYLMLWFPLKLTLITMVYILRGRLFTPWCRQVGDSLCHFL